MEKYPSKRNPSERDKIGRPGESFLTHIVRTVCSLLFQTHTYTKENSHKMLQVMRDKPCFNSNNNNKIDLLEACFRQNHGKGGRARP